MIESATYSSIFTETDTFFNEHGTSTSNIQTATSEPTLTPMCSATTNNLGIESESSMNAYTSSDALCASGAVPTSNVSLKLAESEEASNASSLENAHPEICNIVEENYLEYTAFQTMKSGSPTLSSSSSFESYAFTNGNTISSSSDSDTACTVSSSTDTPITTSSTSLSSYESMICNTQEASKTMDNSQYVGSGTSNTNTIYDAHKTALAPGINKTNNNEACRNGNNAGSSSSSKSISSFDENSCEKSSGSLTSSSNSNSSVEKGGLSSSSSSSSSGSGSKNLGGNSSSSSSSSSSGIGGGSSSSSSSSGAVANGDSSSSSSSSSSGVSFVDSNLNLNAYGPSPANAMELANERSGSRYSSSSRRSSTSSSSTSNTSENGTSSYSSSTSKSESNILEDSTFVAGADGNSATTRKQTESSSFSDNLLETSLEQNGFKVVDNKSQLKESLLTSGKKLVPAQDGKLDFEEENTLENRSKSLYDKAENGNTFSKKVINEKLKTHNNQNPEALFSVHQEDSNNNNDSDTNRLLKRKHLLRKPTLRRKVRHPHYYRSGSQKL